MTVISDTTADWDRDFRLSDQDFTRLASFITGRCGLKMPRTKRAMVEGRLRRRVRCLGYVSMNEYCRYLFQGGGIGQEADAIIDAVTTNKTDFFREPDHFAILERVILPDLWGRFRDRRHLRAWSAAASIGAEAYSIAMVMADFAQDHPGFSFQILGTDICRDVLAQAADAVFPADMERPVPAALRQRYLMRSRHPDRPEVRVVPELRRQVGFAYLNLMDADYPLGDPMQVVFCRNVLIYFDRDTQIQVLSRICTHLMPGGYLLMGHSESANGMGLPLRQIHPTVFVKV